MLFVETIASYYKKLDELNGWSERKRGNILSALMPRAVVFKSNVQLVSHANHPAGPYIAIHKFLTDTVEGQSFTSPDRSKLLSLELRGISSRCVPCSQLYDCCVLLKCVSLFPKQRDDGERKDYTSGWMIGFEQSCCIHFVSNPGLKLHLGWKRST